jgi:uncharacterized protein YlxP (DUF503 family)
MYVELHLPEARSLKDKRASLRPILDLSRRRYRVAIAEVGHQDLHRRAALEVAAVASSQRVVTEVLDAVERLIWAGTGIEVLEARRGYYEDD